MNKHKVIDPNGKVHTRNSKTRTYLYAVVGRSNYEKKVAWITSNAARKQHVDNFNWLNSRNSDRVSQYADGNAYADARVADELAAVNQSAAKGYYDEYGILGWQSRRDLAEKVVDRERKRGMLDLTILEVDG